MSDAEANADLPEAELLEIVLRQTGIERGTVDRLMAEQTAALAQAEQTIGGISYTIHPATATLYVQNFLSQEVLASFQLGSGSGSLFGDSEPPDLNVTLYPAWGSAYCRIVPHSGQIDGFDRADQDHLYGLVITERTAFLYCADPHRTRLLGESYQCFYGRVHQGPRPNTAFDMFLAEDRRTLCVSDREAGTLTLFATDRHEQLGVVQIRPPGSSKALNVSFDYYEPRLFVTDNQSSNLSIVGIEDLQVEKIQLGQPGQICGNIVRAPDVRYLYMLSLKPTMALLAVEIETGYFEETVPLKGQFFSTQHIDPTDLMVLTPDQNHLLLVTSHSEPTPFTPGVVVVDAHQFQPLRLYPIPDALRDQTKPVGLVFPFVNPLTELRKSPLELLVSQGLLSAASLEDIRQRLAQGQLEREQPVVVDLDDPDGPSHGPGKVPALVPVQEAYMALDPALAVPAIVYLLSQKLYQQTEIDLLHHVSEQDKFKAAAESYRQLLENYDSVEVLIEGILEAHRLETYITRQEVLTLMSDENLRSQGMARPPFRCPACNARLKGSWDCPNCRFELESPNRAQKKKLSSLPSLGAVPRYHVLLADPKRRRLVMLDDNKTIDWDLHAQEMGCQAPWSVLMLPNQNLLVVDRSLSQIFECSPTGNRNWTLHQDAGPEYVLNAPVKAGYFSDEYDDHFLVVDQGHHRVVVFDRRQNLLWQYGTLGVAGGEDGQLDTPSDLQRTFDATYLIADTGNHRVLEVDAQGQLVRSFGSRQGLNQPVYAQRLPEYDTLVVDAGNYRVILVDLNGEIISECFYYSEDMGEEMRLDRPICVFRREKQSVVLMDEDKILEIIPAKRRLVWSSLLRHLARRVEIIRDAFDKSGSYVQSFHQYRLPTLEELIARLREENRLGTSTGIAERLMENLQMLVEARRERDAHRGRAAHAQFINETWVQPIPIYVIDRTNQQVVQIDRTGDPLWYFGTLPDYRLLRPSHVTETSDSLLIADTAHDRILEVATHGQEVLRVFGDKTGHRLSKPRSAFRTLSGTTLVTDQGNKRLVEFDREGQIIWEYAKPREISYPAYAMELGKNTILFVDWALQFVREITRQGEVIWAYGQPSRIGHDPNQLASPEYAVSLPSGAILIADTGNNRVVEVTPQRKVLWEFSSNTKFSLYRPNWCQRLPNGNTLIAHQNFRCLLEVNRDSVATWTFELGTDPMIRLREDAH